LSSISAKRVPRSYWERRRRCSSRKFCPARGAKRPAEQPVSELSQVDDRSTRDLTNVLGVLNAATHLGRVVSSWKWLFCATHRIISSPKDLGPSARRASVWVSHANLGAEGRMLEHDRAVAKLLHEAVFALNS
ncbi:MAG: hypothetical protein L6R39_003343, partial [Caloplaca ligustica]